MEYQRGSADFLSEHRPGYEFCGMFFGFPFPDLPANDEAAVDVEDKVEIVVHSLYGARKPAYVPAPYFVRPCGFMGSRYSGHSLDASSPVLLLAMFAEDPVEGGFRGNVFSPIRQGGYNLAWREICEFRIPGYLEDFLLLLRRKGVGRTGTDRLFSPVFPHSTFFNPTLKASQGDAEFFTCHGFAGSAPVSFLDEGAGDTAI
jgi:hypothetical protein